MYFSDRGAKIQKDTFRYVVSKRIFSTRGRRQKKIHLETWYLNVSFCIFPPRSERHTKDTFRYMRYLMIHSDAQTPKDSQNRNKHWPNFSSEFQFSNSRSTGDSDSLHVNQQSDQRSAKENACRRRMLLQNHVQIRPYIPINNEKNKMPK